MNRGDALVLYLSRFLAESRFTLFLEPL